MCKRTRAMKLFCFCLFFLFLQGCTTLSPDVHVIVEWADVVRWNGNIYSLDEEKSRQGDYRIPHEELSVVSFTVVGSEEEENPAYELRDHEATMAPMGTRIQSIKGIDPDQYILVGNNVYRVRD